VGIGMRMKEALGVGMREAFRARGWCTNTSRE
jgi:hypothetical protein